MKSLSKKMIPVIVSMMIVAGVGAVPPASAQQDPTGSTGRCGTLVVLPRVLGKIGMDYANAILIALEVLIGKRDIRDKEVDVFPEQVGKAPRLSMESSSTIPFMDEATRERLYSQFCL
jgi:hypothetical protein